MILRLVQLCWTMLKDERLNSQVYLYLIAKQKTHGARSEGPTAGSQFDGTRLATKLGS